jgi:menaquinone-9 beta-reductase
MAAVRLARAGASVSLFDPSHPREKPCGGGLTGRALALIDDVIDITSLAPVVVRSALIESASSRSCADIPLIDRGASAESTLLVVSRTLFDRALVDAAVEGGARFVPRKVVDVSRSGLAMVVGTTDARHEFDYVLGADGANSLVRRRFAAPFTREQLSVAAGFFAHGIHDSAIALETLDDPPGYLWSFPRRDHLAIGICAPASRKATSPDLRQRSQVWIDRHYRARAATLTPYAWPIPTIGFDEATRLTCSGPGWMLLGDAAGLVDPLTREGIYYALLSGQWAAEALIAAADRRAEARYAERLRSEVHPELARAARLTGMFFSPRFSALLVDALRQSTPIRDVFVDLVAGAQPYTGLRRRLLATREWALAAQAIRLAVMPAFTGTIRPVVSPQAT